MRRFLLRLMKFIIALPFLWACLFALPIALPGVESRFIAKETSWGFVNAKSQEWQELESDSLDILFLGSSTCYSGINPLVFRELNHSAFSLCSSAQAIQHSQRLAKAAFQEVVPGMVALDVYPKNWASDFTSAEPVHDWIVNSNLWEIHWAIAYVQMAISSHSPYALLEAFYFPIRRLFGPAGERAPSDPYGDYMGKGFVFRTFPPLDEMPQEAPSTVTMSSATCHGLTELKKLCDAHDAELVLINPPQLIEELFERPECVKGLLWIDGNDWPGSKTPSLYYDDHHLIGEGGQMYSEWLALQIKERAKSLR